MRFDGGVWDTSRQVVFISTERVVGGSDPLQTAAAIDAVDIATGKPLWRRDCPGEPIDVVSQGVVATRWRPGESHLTLWLLDRDDGRVVTECTMPLPAWTGAPGVTLSVESATEAKGEQSGSLLLIWHGVSVYAGGAPPSQEILDSYTRDERGGLRLNLAQCTTQAVSGNSVVGQPPAMPFAMVLKLSQGEQSVAVAGDTALTLHLQSAEGSTLPPGSATLTLTARTRADSTIRWHYPIRDVIRQMPPPLPQ